MKHIYSTILGFPRIGAQRELKRVLEKYWKGEASESDLYRESRSLRAMHWQKQIDAGIDILPVNDFSLYDGVLDLTFQLKAIPKRYEQLGDKSPLRQYFAMARGEKSESITAMEMSKWFDTNYHYIVPEFSSETTFADLSETPESEIKILQEIKEAQVVIGDDMNRIRPVIIGPVTYFKLGKCSDDEDILPLFSKMLESYITLLRHVKNAGVIQVQLDEPMLATDLDETTKALYILAYEKIAQAFPQLQIFLATYFDDLHENVELVAKLPVHIVHLDLVRGSEHAVSVLAKAGKRLSLGLIDGRNIWKNDLNATVVRMKKLVSENKNQEDGPWFISSSCSLLHCPFDVSYEKTIPAEIVQWFSFSLQKLREISILSLAYQESSANIEHEIQENSAAVESRKNSTLVHKADVVERIRTVSLEMAQRKSPFSERKIIQKEIFHLPLFPTSTIGSYPQTSDIRKARADLKKNLISEDEYTRAMKKNIEDVVRFQEEVDIDVLVHGEPERNDMVEYFGEHFDGYVSTVNGWVQSYGSRCVKPPIIYGDLSRISPITVEWICYAQSLTKRPMKAMLTGPITILQWSFVRDDQARADTAMQIALLIRDEVMDLEQAGISVVQVDEPAIREGLPLRKRDHASYLQWSIKSFKVATCCVKDETQIHTHMCYSEFNEMIESIAALDADVISIEASRSDMDLLNAFKNFQYPNDIGPGVYDIHSPRVPSVDEIVELLEKAMQYIPKEQIWVNPDCGLKTRAWTEVRMSLANLVAAAKILRKRCEA